MRVWFPRLLRAPVGAPATGREAMWNDNRETLRGAFGGRESLFGYALRMHFARRRRFPVELAAYPVVRLRTVDEVARWLERAQR